MSRHARIGTGARQGRGVRMGAWLLSTAALLWVGVSPARAEPRPLLSRGAGVGGGAGAGRALHLAQSMVDPTVPEYHRVDRGDTLWGLCERYFRDPWRWPRLWALNPAITNPHFIYPGDRIRLRRAARSRVSAPARPRAALRISVGGGGGRSHRITLRLRGFVAEEDLPKEASITGSREEKILLSTYDHVYIRYPEGKPLRVGARYQVYKTLREVAHPRTHKRMGKMVKLLGEVEVRRLSKAHVAEGIITQAINPIERGALVGTLKRTFVAVRPVAYAGARITGIVTAVLGNRNLIGTRQLVFLDRGREAGVRLGFVFHVIRRGDSYRAITQFEERVRPQERSWPREAVAAIVVVHLGKRYAVGYVAKAAQEIRIGDQVVAGGGARPAARAAPHQ